MYGWIWQRLPGRPVARAAVLTVLIVAVALLLWYVVYPWAAVHLPLDQGAMS